MKAFTIFGGTGDLTFRKLLPALYNAGESGGPGADYRILINALWQWKLYQNAFYMFFFIQFFPRSLSLNFIFISQ